MTCLFFVRDFKNLTVHRATLTVFGCSVFFPKLLVSTVTESKQRTNRRAIRPSYEYYYYYIIIVCLRSYVVFSRIPVHFFSHISSFPVFFFPAIFFLRVRFSKVRNDAETHRECYIHIIHIFINKIVTPKEKKRRRKSLNNHKKIVSVSFIYLLLTAIFGWANTSSATCRKQLHFTNWSAL